MKNGRNTRKGCSCLRFIVKGTTCYVRCIATVFLAAYFVFALLLLSIYGVDSTMHELLSREQLRSNEFFFCFRHFETRPDDRPVFFTREKRTKCNDTFSVVCNSFTFEERTNFYETLPARRVSPWARIDSEEHSFPRNTVPRREISVTSCRSSVFLLKNADRQNPIATAYPRANTVSIRVTRTKRFEIPSDTAAKFRRFPSRLPIVRATKRGKKARLGVQFYGKKREARRVNSTPRPSKGIAQSICTLLRGSLKAKHPVFDFPRTVRSRLRASREQRVLVRIPVRRIAATLETKLRCT